MNLQKLKELLGLHKQLLPPPPPEKTKTVSYTLEVHLPGIMHITKGTVKLPLSVNNTKLAILEELLNHRKVVQVSSNVFVNKGRILQLKFTELLDVVDE